MKDYTVYSSKAEDGMLRMALHLMDSAPNIDWEQTKKWPFRVVYLYRNNMYYNRSCRGADSGFCDPFGDIDDALKWLIEGEDP